MIAGLINPTAGKISFDGEDIVPIPSEKRGAVMVFQNYLLFPYMSVGDNVGFGLKMRGVDKQIIKQKVQQMLELVKLPDIAKRLILSTVGLHVPSTWPLHAPKRRIMGFLQVQESNSSLPKP